MNSRASSIVVLSLLGSCNSPAPSAHRPQAPAPSAVSRSASPLTTDASDSITRQACNRTDSASVFLVRSPGESRALSDRLTRGAVAVRYHDCRVELLADCDVDAHGTIAVAQSCCETDMGCVGDDVVECDGQEEHYWFGNEREWLLNLPEVAARLRGSSAAKVRAKVRRAYYLERSALSRPSCADATHVLIGARWGSLAIDAESGGGAATEPRLTPLVRRSEDEQLVDVSLLSIAELEPTPKIQPACMEILEPSGGGAPAAFLGRQRPPLPERCRAARAPASPDQLQARCEQWTSQSAWACTELSQSQEGEAAVDYAWRACQRARKGCEHVVELLQAQAKEADPRYQAALRLACASGKHELCCEWAQQQLDVTSARNEALGVLRYYCADSVQSCCKVLSKRGYQVPPRRQRPY